jgi:A/G-specific adenine glycosylase
MDGASPFLRNSRCATIHAVSLISLPPRQLRKFRRKLLAWFTANQRDLPWRRTKDPYRVWLSEIMLQQTRVAAVVPYYSRFLERFPTLTALARARTEAVLQRWAGLGYYSRARNLHRAAKEILARHGGHFPRGYDAAVSLPGIGRYTASAVLSIAYAEPLAVLDGNVARVLARLGAVRGNLRAPATWKKLDDTARTLLARDAPGDWNQAMMELGATLCTPKSPRCAECPVSAWCRARKLGIAGQLPAARAKQKPVQITLAAAVLLDPRGKTLVIRQGDGALFSHLWQFPVVEITTNGATQLRQHLKKIFGFAVDGRMTPLDAARHTVTFRQVRLEPYLVRVAKLPEVQGARKPSLTRLADLPISGATRKIADAAISYSSAAPFR